MRETRKQLNILDSIHKVILCRVRTETPDRAFLVLFATNQCEKQKLHWKSYKNIYRPTPVADPEFSRGGVPTRKVGREPIILLKFPPKNCMKILKIELRRVARPRRPPWIRHCMIHTVICNCVLFLLLMSW